MKTFKIFGDKYPLSPTSSKAPDAYAIKGKLVDEQPKGKLKGFTTMEDGSVIACYKRFNPMVIILPLLLICGLAAGGYYYLTQEQPKDVVVAGITIKEGVDNNVVKYNGFTVIRDGVVYIYFTNGDYPCKIQIVGEGIDCAVYDCQPAEYVECLPVTYTTAEALLNAKLVITTETSTQENDIVIEIPENNTANSPSEGMEGYWQGEYIYGGL